MQNADILERIAKHAGLFDRSDRHRLAVSGPDRAKFLHNLLTNEIKRLPAGKGCEAFVTSPQGKTLAYVKVLAADDAILLGADPGGIAALLPHLQKYGVFDDVVIDDRSATTFELHLAGPAAEEIVRSAGAGLPENTDLAHAGTEMFGQPVRVVRESPAGLPGFTLLGDVPAGSSVKVSLLAAGRDLGLVEAVPEVFEILRIEAGTPVFGKDITDKNLPQEIDRDARAINFVKGCYLGQETVARLDALGHVNQILRGVVFEPGASLPPAGSASRMGISEWARSRRWHSHRSRIAWWAWRSCGPAMRRRGPRSGSNDLMGAMIWLRPSVRCRWRRPLTRAFGVDPLCELCQNSHASYGRSNLWRQASYRIHGINGVGDLSG